MNVKDYLEEVNPDAIILDGMDAALIGVVSQCGTSSVACYDKDLIIQVLMADMGYQEALEFYEFNILGAYLGEHTPMFLERV